MTQIPVKFIGPNRFCPICKRALVKMNGDGSFDIAGKSALESSFTYDSREDPDYLEAVVFDAICLRWRCRLKKWIETNRSKAGRLRRT